MTPFLLADIKQDESCRLKAYPDPFSPRGRQMAKPQTDRCLGWSSLAGEPWTIGYGHAGPDVQAGTVWTQDQADAALKADVDGCIAELDRNMSWWRQLADTRQDVLVEMCFNLGWPTLSTFHHMWDALDTGDFGKAADEILNSAAARELPSRYNRLAAQMRYGVRAGVRSAANA